jgi:lipopolysaccharide biosynthesis glycosyltransferase
MFGNFISIFCMIVIIIHINLCEAAADDTIEIAAIMCGHHYYTQVGPFLSSLLTNNNASNHRTHMTLFTDAGGIKYLSVCLSQMRAIMSIDLVDIDTYKMSPPLQQLTDQHPRWKCALNKLVLYDMLPPIVKKLLFIDVDTIVQQDLAPLWDQFNIKPNKLFHAVWENDQAEDVPATGWPAMGVNTGVLLVDLERMRQRNVTFETFVVPSEGLISTVGDQAFLNTWLSRHPEELGILPCKWNKRADSNCRDWSDENLRHRSGIAHGPNNAFHKHWDFPYAYKGAFNTLCGFG